ncbi:Pisatin demethylase [Podospora australis]|uniref:Pisatin demethylase n=1 Tax=Podospora australis TaxID=1536484 RepID=A0AAN6WK71_9PEZI|nr:Pisatin demethylase [Podospora australis]
MPSTTGIVDSLVDFRVGQLLSHLPFRPQLVLYFILGPIAAVLTWLVVSEAFSPLRKYPGPFLARYTNLWRLGLTISGRYHWVIEDLHKKYGPVVRIGPNLLDIDYPETIKTSKTEFYHNHSSYVNGKLTYHVFSTTDPAEHARLKRPYVNHFTVGAVMALEPHMETVIADLIKQLDNRFVKGPEGQKTLDLGEWINFYAWDLITSATFSRRFGYMDAGCDHDSTLKSVQKSINYFAVVGQMPWLDFVLDKNPIVRIGPPHLANMIGITVGNLFNRIQGKDPNYTPKTPDFLQHFIDAKTTHPDIVDDGTIIGYLLVNLGAGADTTATSLRSAFYYSLKRPAVYKRLEKEVRAMGWDKDKPVSYSAARQVAYLEAVLLEAFRYHPAVAMPLERYVPDTGLTLPDGSFVPPGTAVGVNPYIAGRNKSVYGDDADEFRPERWLQASGEGDEEYRVRMQKYHAGDLTFGGGSRSCVGKNFALMESFKVLATLVNRYDIELADPDKEWVTWSRWFIWQEGIFTKLSLRE